jgi:hypothetical protein
VEPEVDARRVIRRQRSRGKRRRDVSRLWLWVLARGRARDRPWFAIETLGLVFFGGLTIAAVVADARLAGILAGVGWFTHGLWDAYHFAKDRVVARSWSELCAVVDIPIGTALIVVSIIG